MNLLTYTPPEDRVLPDTTGQGFSYSFDEEDPLWRRALRRVGIEIIEFAFLFVYADNQRPIGPLDHVRWFIEGIGERLFGWGFTGSLNEEHMILNSEIPWRYVDQDKKRAMIAKYPGYFMPSTGPEEEPQEEEDWS